jgi:hypothetical protein
VNVVNELIAAAAATLEQLRKSPVSQVRQLTTAFVGLAVIVTLPAILVYWARKRWRP